MRQPGVVLFGLGVCSSSVKCWTVNERPGPSTLQRRVVVVAVGPAIHMQWIILLQMRAYWSNHTVVHSMFLSTTRTALLASWLAGCNRKGCRAPSPVLLLATQMCYYCWAASTTAIKQIELRRSVLAAGPGCMPLDGRQGGDTEKLGVYQVLLDYCGIGLLQQLVSLPCLLPYVAPNSFSDCRQWFGLTSAQSMKAYIEVVCKSAYTYIFLLTLYRDTRLVLLSFLYLYAGCMLVCDAGRAVSV